MFCRRWTHARSPRRYGTTRHASSHQVVRPKDGAGRSPAQTIGVELDPSGEPRPCGGVGKNQSNRPGIGPTWSQRTTAWTILFTRRRMRSLEVLCKKSATITTRSPYGCLVFRVNYSLLELSGQIHQNSNHSPIFDLLQTSLPSHISAHTLIMTSQPHTLGFALRGPAALRRARWLQQ